MASAITPKQQRFVDEYLIDLNATAAAKRAGYSEKTAGSQGFDLLKKPEIAQALADAQERRQARTEISQDQVVRELARLGLSDIRKILGPDGGLMDLANIDDDTAAAIASVEVIVRQGGEDAPLGHVHKIKLWDKNSALEKLARHLGMFNDKLNLDHTASGGPIDLWGTKQG